MCRIVEHSSVDAFSILFAFRLQVPLPDRHPPIPLGMKKNTHSAFTLIELLTVIAVIAVLAAILIPAIGTVRMNAFETQGLSNIRQVGMSYLMVAQEDGGILPSVYGDEKKRSMGSPGECDFAQ